MKKVSWALIGFSTIALSVGSSAHADAQSDTQIYCTGCHDGIVVGANVIGAGNKICANRGYQGWVDTLTRMNVKGCGVPESSFADMANYLTCLETGTPNSCSGGTTTTTTAPVTTTTAPVTTTTTPSTTAATTSTTDAMTTTTGVMTTTTTPVVTTTTTTAPTTTSTATVTTTTTTTNMTGCIKGKKNKIKKCKDEHGNDESDHDGERD